VLLCIRISEKGTLQLSIDTDSMRRTLLEFPRLARPLDEEGDTAQYAHYVEREMGAATNLVKVLQAKPENLVDTFILLMPTGAKTAQDLARICELQVSLQARGLVWAQLFSFQWLEEPC
jgi:hypothetical protein